jgi:hypothetical protein
MVQNERQATLMAGHKARHASLMRAVCGVLDGAGPLGSADIPPLLAILRIELVRGGYCLGDAYALNPWYYLTERQAGATALSCAGKSILTQPADHRAVRVVTNTLKHWRKNHAQQA